MPGTTPNGYPYAQPADPLVQWPATSQSLAEKIDNVLPPKGFATLNGTNQPAADTIIIWKGSAVADGLTASPAEGFITCPPGTYLISVVVPIGGTVFAIAGFAGNAWQEYVIGITGSMSTILRFDTVTKVGIKWKSGVQWTDDNAASVLSVLRVG